MSEASKSIAIPDEVVLSKIYLIRNIKVMIDRDLADLFDVKAIRLREQVKRNIGKFPLHFMFQLTNEEAENMVSQNAIPSKQHLGGALPYYFSFYCSKITKSNTRRQNNKHSGSIQLIG